MKNYGFVMSFQHLLTLCTGIELPGYWTGTGELFRELLVSLISFLLQISTVLNRIRLCPTDEVYADHLCGN